MATGSHRPSLQPAPTGAKPRTDSPYKRGQTGEQVKQLLEFPHPNPTIVEKLPHPFGNIALFAQERTSSGRFFQCAGVKIGAPPRWDACTVPRSKAVELKNGPGVVHIVDDDASFLKAMERRLKQAGYEVATYASAQHLLDHLSFGLLIRLPFLPFLQKLCSSPLRKGFVNRLRPR